MTRIPLEIDPRYWAQSKRIHRPDRATHFYLGNTSFIAEKFSGGWDLNFTPENNRDGNINEGRKILYRHMFGAGMHHLLDLIRMQNDLFEIWIRNTNYRFATHATRVVSGIVDASIQDRHPGLQVDMESSKYGLKFSKFSLCIDARIMLHQPSTVKNLRDSAIELQRLKDAGEMIMW